MPLSNDPDRRAAQLGNLRAGAGKAGPGNQRSRSHGGHAMVLVERLDAREREVFEALGAGAPLRDARGELPDADRGAVRLAAQALCRLDDVGAYLRNHGLLDEDGGMRPALELERKLRLEAADHLAALGCSPRSRAALGLDLVRAAGVAEADVEATRAARERFDARAADLDLTANHNEEGTDEGT